MADDKWNKQLFLVSHKGYQAVTVPGASEAARAAGKFTGVTKMQTGTMISRLGHLRLGEVLSIGGGVTIRKLDMVETQVDDPEKVARSGREQGTPSNPDEKKDC